ncbi:phosphoserine phosphatase [Sphaerisporangium krabiense]|uniref:HAD superfamily hydrolase (TIGR01490 family) n=1 Tax=Sphaerisporangium krabiense TaxID=763782 RepID=A0A7W8Z127_9ACTN|nr:HAD-IB family hydrolase [Sphaerisporangium krabiense]MBB5625516.1 HAD superfamily hydrolase (TIGR01490 family) [Sphaerisporangium krabiense]GII63154.1 phosphoserine phosphatase [Sphaerisporangium krabiense]
MRRLLRRHTEAEIAGEVAAAAAVAAPAAEPDTTAAAFFDVDNTMMRGASIYHFARGLASRGLFTTTDLLRFAIGQALFRVRGNENPEHIARAKETALAFVVGLKVDEVVRLGEEIYDEVMADRIWNGTRALAQSHLDAGQRVWLVTATPVELSRVIAQRLGLTGALGTVAETENGVYTGRLVGDLLHGPAKAEAVKALARREGLDLSRCTAYSDSANDLPLLRLVGRPCAINPDSELLEHARQNDWTVRDFRTGRKATMIGLPIAAGAGALAGGVAAAIALRKYYRSL